jgi:hypothetical protein
MVWFVAGFVTDKEQTPLSKKGEIILELKHHSSHQLSEDIVQDNIV